MAEHFRSGYVALVGRPNVGKSTLLNRLLGQKISITSRRPQTTRHRILGIRTTRHAQVMYVDTPGIHSHAGRAMNRFMNRAAIDALHDVDIIIFMVEGGGWTDEDEGILEKIVHTGLPVVLVINKIDRLADKTGLLLQLEQLSGKMSFQEMIPLSARSGDHVDVLEKAIERLLPVAPPYYPDDQITDRSERFLAAEFIREKLFRKLGREVPYGLTVEIERFREEGDVVRIHGLILVERPGQKAIVIGKHGALLKEVGRQARLDIEQTLKKRVYLQLWVKVKQGWADDERALRSLGYTDE